MLCLLFYFCFYLFLLVCFMLRSVFCFFVFILCSPENEREDLEVVPRLENPVDAWKDPILWRERGDRGDRGREGEGGGER